MKLLWDHNHISEIEWRIAQLEKEADYWSKGASTAFTAYRTSHPEIVEIVRKTVKNLEAEKAGQAARDYWDKELDKRDRDNAMKPEYV